jgi:hypothetical protein
MYCCFDLELDKYRLISLESQQYLQTLQNHTLVHKTTSN